MFFETFKSANCFLWWLCSGLGDKTCNLYSIKMIMSLESHNKENMETRVCVCLNFLHSGCFIISPLHLCVCSFNTRWSIYLDLIQHIFKKNVSMLGSLQFISYFCVTFLWPLRLMKVLCFFFSLAVQIEYLKYHQALNE